MMHSCFEKTKKGLYQLKINSVSNFLNSFRLFFYKYLEFKLSPSVFYTSIVIPFRGQTIKTLQFPAEASST